MHISINVICFNHLLKCFVVENILNISQSPLNIGMRTVGTYTQRVIDDCITPPDLSGVSAYIGDAHRKAEKVIITLQVQITLLT